jgi:hypothetical protein
LAAHAETSGQFAASDRPSVVPHPRDNPVAPLIGGIKSQAL